MKFVAGEKGIRVLVQVRFERDGDGFHAYAPALKGCHVVGDNLDEARAAIKEAVQLYIRSLLKHGDPIPVGCLVEETDQRASPERLMAPLLPTPTPIADIQTSVESLDLTVPVPA